MITLGIASQIKPGRVTGIDLGRSQIERAQANATQAGIDNALFLCANRYSLPFAKETFDRVFSHALMEHLSEPMRALHELFRVLKPGGAIGMCSPDWGGFVLTPPSPELADAVNAYKKLQSKNRGRCRSGQEFGLHLAAAGFTEIQLSARYECYRSPGFIGEYLALQLKQHGDARSADSFRTWSKSDACMFAQAWVSAFATKQ